ncbi:MAG: glycosyltransferase family 39 protein [Anaerolineales bacterium]|nr:glycosyltransferase family 39 protein [Anaerolineales bacterium]
MTAFLPRVIYPVARSRVWHDRGILFLDALQSGNLAETIQSAHPGIMTMWLIGAARWVGLTWLPEQYNSNYFSQISLEIVPLTLVISLLIVLAYFLLSKLFNPTAALVATFLLALDPFHISISKTVHVDALMAVFLLISALFVLVFINQQESASKRPLFFSAVFAGLALLTKTPSLFIIPFLMLSLLVWQLDKVVWPGAVWPNRQQILQISKQIARTVLMWSIVLLVTFVVLNPALWADPVGTMRIMFTGTSKYFQTPHPYPLLFNGIFTENDPGLLFYPINMTLKSTAVVTIAFIAGLPVLFMRQINRSKRITLWLLFAFILFFSVQMTLAEKKGTRYVLPALQGIILFAGTGTTLMVQKMRPQHRKLSLGLLTMLVLVQAAISLPHHPYYGTHYNRLMGTPESILGSNLVAGQEQGEGLDMAAAYLNNLPNAKSTVVGVQISEAFAPHYNGTAITLTDESPDYLVFSRNWLVRNMQRENWQETWAAYKDRPPKYVVAFDDVTYVWVYKTGPVIDETSVEHWLPARLGSEIRLLGYAFEPKMVAPGDSVTLTLYWEAAQETAVDYTVFTHLLNEQGELLTQQDSQPQGGIYPTYIWDSGERVADTHTLIIPPDTPDGPATLAIGMYTLATLERLPIAHDPDLNIQDDRLLLPGPTITSGN